MLALGECRVPRLIYFDDCVPIHLSSLTFESIDGMSAASQAGIFL